MKKILSFLIAAVTAVSVLSQGLCASALFTIEEVAEEPVVVPEEQEEVIFFEPVDTDSFTAKQSDSGEICLTFYAKEGAVKYTVYIYDEAKKKYCIHESVEIEDFEDWMCCFYRIDHVEASKEYKILVRQFDKDGEVLFSKKASVTTREADPVLIVSKVTKPTITWKASDEKATGYEMYVKKETPEDFNSYKIYRDYTLKEIKEAGFKLLCKSDEEASGSKTLKTKTDYTVIFRTFYLNEKGEKVYSGFSRACNTGDVSSYINGLTLKPKAVCDGEELKLVKKYVNETITDDMSNYEKLEAIFELVNSHGNYQDDINKIDGNRPVWQIMEKQEGQCASWAYCLDAMLEYVGFDVKVVRGLRSSGQQHFWCQIKVNGQWYDLDAHLGAFLWPYYGDYREYVIADRY